MAVYHAVKGGAHWQIPVTGYDPRDLLRGRYIRFLYDLPPQPAKECGTACAVCLNGDVSAPAISWTNTSSAPSLCNAWFNIGARQQQRFYIPEDIADRADALMRTQSDTITALVSVDNGHIRLETLLINGTKDIRTYIREQRQEAETDR